MIRLSRCLLAVLFVAGLNLARAAESSPLLRLERTIPLDGVTGRIDHLALDGAGGRLFVAAYGNRSLEVVDVRAGRRLASLRGLAAPQGVAYDPQTRRVFVTCAGDATCRIYDAASTLTLSKIAAFPSDPDSVRLTHEAIYVGYGGNGIRVLDPKTGEMRVDYLLPGHAEAFEVGLDTIYVNVPEAREVTQIMLGASTAFTHWSLGGLQANFPMALDDRSHRLYVGTRRPAMLAVFDTLTGMVIARAPIGGDVDDLYFDSAHQRLYAVCGAGSVTILQKKVKEDQYMRVGDVVTAPGARTGLFAPASDTLYVAAPAREGHPAAILVYHAAQ